MAEQDRVLSNIRTSSDCPGTSCPFVCFKEAASREQGFPRYVEIHNRQPPRSPCTSSTNQTHHMSNQPQHGKTTHTIHDAFPMQQSSTQFPNQQPSDSQTINTLTATSSRARKQQHRTQLETQQAQPDSANNVQTANTHRQRSKSQATGSWSS